MLKEVLRFIFFQTPSIFLNGLAFILFDKQEILDVRYQLRTRKKTKTKKEIENSILVQYLERCKKEQAEDLNEDSKEKRKKD